MTIKREHKVWPIKYEVNDVTESQISQIVEWVESQEVPESIVDEAMFIERLVQYMINKFGEKSISQKNYFLIIIDLILQKEINVNNQIIKISKTYMSCIEPNMFNFEYDILREPIIELLDSNLIYQSILLISFYSNLGFGTYETAEGYEGTAEDVKLEYLEYLVAKNVKNIDDLKLVLKNFIPEINSGSEISYGKNRKFLVSEVALELIQIETFGLMQMPKISIPGLIYGIFRGFIKEEDIKKINLKQILNSKWENIFDELDNLLSNLAKELDLLDYDPILRDILRIEGSVKQLRNIRIETFKALFDFIVSAIALSIKENYRNEQFIDTLTDLFIVCFENIDSKDLINEYNSILKNLGVDLIENARERSAEGGYKDLFDLLNYKSKNHEGKSKSKWFKKFISRD